MIGIYFLYFQVLLWHITDKTFSVYLWNDCVLVVGDSLVPFLSSQCKFCGREGTITMIPGRGKPLTQETAQSGGFSRLMLFNCRGYEPVDFIFGEGWKVESVSFFSFPHSFWIWNIRHISSGGWKWLVSTALCYQSASCVFVFMIMHEDLHFRYISSFLMHFTVVNIFNIEFLVYRFFPAFSLQCISILFDYLFQFSLYGFCLCI